MGCDIEFDQAMDQTVQPGNTTFQITSDGVPLVCTVTGWSSAYKVSVQTTGTPPVVTGYVSQLIQDPLCRSLAGTFARPQADLQWFP